MVSFVGGMWDHLFALNTHPGDLGMCIKTSLSHLDVQIVVFFLTAQIQRTLRGEQIKNQDVI